MKQVFEAFKNVMFSFILLAMPFKYVVQYIQDWKGSHWVQSTGKISRIESATKLC